MSAKSAAAGASVAFNEAGATLATGAALIGPKNIGVGVVFGVGSAAAWYAGSQYQSVANDPPREDLDEVAKFEGLRFDLPAPVHALQNPFQALTENMVSQAVCIGNLIKSIERHDGALAVKQVSSKSLLASQARAVEHNAEYCANLLDDLLGNLNDLNVAFRWWVRIIERLMYREARTRLSEDFKEQLPRLRAQFCLSEDDFADLSTSVTAGISTMKGALPLPTALFDDNSADIFRAMSAELRSMAAEYRDSAIGTAI
ncbi:hypothetical protein ACW9HM_05105 [Nocardia gipuzkoensis]